MSLGREAGRKAQPARSLLMDFLRSVPPASWPPTPAENVEPAPRPGHRPLQAYTHRIPCVQSHLPIHTLSHEALHTETCPQEDTDTDTHTHTRSRVHRPSSRHPHSYSPGKNPRTVHTHTQRHTLNVHSPVCTNLSAHTHLLSNLFWERHPWADQGWVSVPG